MRTCAATDPDVYYSGKYWNDYGKVGEYMNKHMTGNPKTIWWQHFKHEYAKKPFKNALFLNCGNGWVERLFIDKKIVQKATAFDFSKKLLKEAESKMDDRPITYIVADANNTTFKKNEFDLVVNVAALHHVQYINKLCLSLANAMKSDSLIVNFDYVGPRRNQYPSKQWKLIKQINQKLPKSFRKERLDYPHLPTMLLTDPTEAIHAPLIFQTISRYFDMIHRGDSGGGIAYTILTHNPNLEILPAQQRDALIGKVLKLDEQLTNDDSVPVLFSYFVARVNKQKLRKTSTLALYQLQENIRELFAKLRFGAYSWIGFAQILVNKIKRILKYFYTFFGFRKP